MEHKAQYKKSNDLQAANAPAQKKSKAAPLEDNRPHSVAQLKPNKTGLPDQLKLGIEKLSGHSMDDVRVHYNSPKPAQLNAHAYAQGTDIHIAPGQDRHVPHEAWHIAQQKQGRVKPTMQMKGKININDDSSLEKEADVMGGKALQMKEDKNIKKIPNNLHTYTNVIQRIQDLTDDEWTAQGTVLSAEIEGGGHIVDLGKYHSGGGHAEDNLIADLPNKITTNHLPPGHYSLFFIINRSPCTSTPFNGTVTSNKGPGIHGCMEKLMHLQANGLIVNGNAYTFQVQAIAKHLYGKNSDERATSSNAVERGQAGGVQLGVGTGFFDTGAAKSKSMVEQ